jgi:hypothetical protein
VRRAGPPYGVHCVRPDGPKADPLKGVLLRSEQLHPWLNKPG